MRQAAPSAIYEFENLRTSEIHQRLERAQLDIGVVRSSRKQKGFEYADFGQIEFALFVPGDSLGRNARNPLQILKRLQLGTLIGSGTFNRELARALGEVGIDPKIGNLHGVVPNAKGSAQDKSHGGLSAKAG